MAAEYYYARDGQRFGPFSGVQLKTLAASGQLRPTDQIWSPEKKAWLPAASIPALFQVAPPVPVQPVPVAAKPAAAPVLPTAVKPAQPVPMPVQAPSMPVVLPVTTAGSSSSPRWGLILGIGGGSVVGLALLIWLIITLTRSSDTGLSGLVAHADKKDLKREETKKEDGGDIKKEVSTKDPKTKKETPVVDPRIEPKTPPRGDPNPAAEAQLEKGNTAFANGNMDEAIRAYTDALNLQPNFAWALCKRGQAYMNKADYAKAIADCNKALEINPKLIDAYAFRCASEYDGKNFAAAIDTATLALKVDAKSTFFYVIRGKAHVILGAPERGVADLDQAIRLNPKNAQYYDSRGAAHAKIDNPKLAQADFAQRDALESAAMSPAKRQAYARLQQAEADYKLAEAEYEADYRRYEMQRNTYQAQAGRAKAMGVILRPPLPADPQLQRLMQNARASVVQAKRVFDETP